MPIRFTKHQKLANTFRMFQSFQSIKAMPTHRVLRLALRFHRYRRHVGVPRAPFCWDTGSPPFPSVGTYLYLLPTTKWLTNLPFLNLFSKTTVTQTRVTRDFDGTQAFYHPTLQSQSRSVPEYSSTFPVNIATWENRYFILRKLVPLEHTNSSIMVAQLMSSSRSHESSSLS